MFSGLPSELTSQQITMFIIVMIWSLIWKGLALWKAGRNNQLVIFIILLVINTLGVGEIIYLAYMYYKTKKSVVPQTTVTPPQI
jgi:hypothetical protein